MTKFAAATIWYHVPERQAISPAPKVSNVLRRVSLRENAYSMSTPTSKSPGRAKIYLRVTLIFGALAYLFSHSQVTRGLSGRFLASDGTRGPASIEKVFDFSYLEGDALLVAARDRVASSLVVSSSDDKTSVTLNFGNFVTINERKEREFACGFYDQIVFAFEADGVSVNGEKPLLVIQSGCEVGANLNELLPIRLSVSKLTSQPSNNSELKFFENRQPLTVQLSNASPEWPKKWILIDLKLSNSKISSRILHISSDEWRRKGRDLSMNW